MCRQAIVVQERLVEWLRNRIRVAHGYTHAKILAPICIFVHEARSFDLSFPL